MMALSLASGTRIRSLFNRNRRSTFMASSSSSILYDAPVSNHGARVRFVIYKKGLESEFKIESPGSLGGLKSEAYMKLNPQGKMPLLVLPDGSSLPESEVIVQYLLDKYSAKGPSLLAATPELRAKAALATRIHDLYIAPVQGSMYRQMDSASQRSKDLAQINLQLDVLEKIIEGPFVAGSSITAADGALFPTAVFLDFILPTYFGWKGLWETRPKLKSWWTAVNSDSEAARVIAEVRGGLQGWADSDRWNAMGINEHLKNKDFKWSY